MALELECERSRWNTERDALDADRRDMKEYITQLEKRKDDLVKENEKLRLKQKKQAGTHPVGNARYMSGYSSMTGSNSVLSSAMNKLNS